MEFYFDVVNNILIWASLAVSLNLLMGYAGQFAMSHAAFYGIGAYTAGLLVGRLEWNSWLAVGVAVVLTSVAAMAVSLPAALRVRGDYVILLTLAFQLIVHQLMGTFYYAGGAYGFALSPLEIGGISLSRPSRFLPLMIGVASLAILVSWRVGESSFGRLLKGIRDDEDALRALGENTVKTKLLVFGVSSAIAGFVGAIGAFYLLFVAPVSYSVDVTIFVVAIVVLGGLGSPLGSLIAAAALGAMRPLLQLITFIEPNTSFVWQAIFYGSALILVARFRPEGLVPERVHLRSRARRVRKLLEGLSRGEADRGIVDPPGARYQATRQVSDESLREDRADLAEPERHQGNDDPIVVVRNVRKAFGGIQAVDGVDFELSKGSVAALVGPNGAGKTTIFNLVTGAIRPDDGKVFLRGRDITGESSYRVARLGMARSFQDLRLFTSLTVLDNVALATPEQRGDRVIARATKPRSGRERERLSLSKAMAALRVVGIEASAHEFVSSLSFAEQKLVALARLLATECEVLLLDEPMAGIDPSSIEAMINLIKRLRSLDHTVCVIEHSIHVVEQVADEILFLEEGRISARGTVKDVISQERLASVYFGA